MTTIIGLIDGIICGILIFMIISSKFGSKPLGRALSILVALPIGILYFIWEQSLAETPSTQLADWVYPTVLFAPIGLFLVLLFFSYVFKGKSK